MKSINAWAVFVEKSISECQQNASMGSNLCPTLYPLDIYKSKEDAEERTKQFREAEIKKVTIQYE